MRTKSPPSPIPPCDPGDLVVSYTIRASPNDVDALAQDLAVEQSVEVTASLWQHPEVAGRTVGVVEEVREAGEGRFEVRIRYPAATVGREVAQVLGTVYGNASLKHGVRVERIEPGPDLARALGGPRFGVEGMRDAMGVPSRPLLASALKPLGRSIRELADYAYRLARGGLDLLKDDHGLTNQAICPFEARVEACSEAVRRANRETGGHTQYFACVTGPVDEILPRALFARAVGAGGVLLSPLVVGLDALRLLSRRCGLPVMAHPALTGAFFAALDHGMSHPALLGTLLRLCGADLVIFPSWGGRFPFTREVCAQVDCALKEDLHGLRRAWPVPAGGMTPERVHDLLALHGHDVVLLVGSSLYERSPDLTANARALRDLVEAVLGSRGFLG